MKKIARVFCVLSFIFCSPFSRALITADNLVAQTDPFDANGLGWDFVYRHPDGSCVAVASNWILTASHVADYGGDGTLEIGGTNYLKQEIIYHGTADLALIRYDREFPGYYELSSDATPLNSTLLLVGYGNTGVVHRVRGRSYFADSGSGRNTKRWGSNVATSMATWNYSAGPSFTSVGFVMPFDEGGSEAGVGTYDSGGGSFIQQEGGWTLAGINTARGATWTDEGYDQTFAVSVSAYSEWIYSIVIATNDFDEDGLPNGWEQQFGTTTGVVPGVDQDGDGFLGYDEWIADTDPTDGESFLHLDALAVSTNQIFTFSGSPNRAYRMASTTNDLADSNLVWTVHEPAVVGAGSHTQLVLSNAEQRVFYQLRVIQP